MTMIWWDWNRLLMPNTLNTRSWLVVNVFLGHLSSPFTEHKRPIFDYQGWEHETNSMTCPKVRLLAKQVSNMCQWQNQWVQMDKSCCLVPGLVKKRCELFSASPSGMRCYLYFNLLGDWYIPRPWGVAVIQLKHLSKEQSVWWFLLSLCDADRV